MTLRQLELLRSVARQGSLSGAARELGLSQPAVSMQMKALAADVGASLLRARGRRLEVTPAGAVLAEHAERILRLAADAATAARLGSREAAVVRVAASSTPGVNLLPARMAAFRRRHPQVVVRLEVLNSEEVERRVARGEVDFGVVGGQRSSRALAAERWCDDELVLITPRRHRLARRRVVGAADLARETLLAREAGSATQAAVQSAFLRAGLPLPATQTVGDTEAIKRCVAAGIGIAIVSRFAASGPSRPGNLSSARVTGLDLRRPLQVIHDPRRGLSPPAKSFLDFLRVTAPTPGSRPKRQRVRSS